MVRAMQEAARLEKGHCVAVIARSSVEIFHVAAGYCMTELISQWGPGGAVLGVGQDGGGEL